MGCDKNWHHVGINESEQQVDYLISKSGILCPRICIMYITFLECYEREVQEKNKTPSTLYFSDP